MFLLENSLFLIFKERLIVIKIMNQLKKVTSRAQAWFLWID